MRVTWEALRRTLGLAEPETEALTRDRVSRNRTDTELAAEFGPYTGMTDLPFAEGDYQHGPDSGIRVSPVPVTKGEELEIKYNGLLAQSGADAVFLHYGFGPGNWRGVREVPMRKTDDGQWTARVYADGSGRFSFCFRDSLYNWDNNSGNNWSYLIHGSDERQH